MSDYVIFSHPCTHAPANVSRDMVYMSGTRPKRTPMQKVVRRILGVITIAVIIWGLYSIPYGILRQERFRLFGEQRTSGLVLAIHSEETRPDTNPQLIIEYKYVDQDGFAHTTTAPLPNSLWQKYRPGSKVEVYYARSQPGLARVPNEIEPPFQIWLRNLLQ